MPILPLLVILLLVLANALYVAGEFAAVGVRRSRVHEKVDAGSRLATRLLPILEDTSRLDRYIATCQIGITFSSLVLGAYGQIALTPPLAATLQGLVGMGAVAAFSTSAVVVLVGLTATQVVLGELVPKSLALQFPTRTALATVVPVSWSARAFTPFIWVLNGSALALLRALRVPPGGHRHVHSPEEIEMLVAESHDGGLLEPEEHRRLAGALHLRRLPAHQLMVPRPRVLAVDVDEPIERVVRAVAEAPFTRIPVYRGDFSRLVGFLHTKDVFLKRASGGHGATVEALMRPIPRVLEDTPGDRLLAALRDSRAHIAAVENADGHAVGIVTFEDVLAEMIGGRTGDLAATDLAPEPLPDGRVRLSGLLPVARMPEWARPEGRVESRTVGGLVMERLGRVPAAGDRLRIGGGVLEVERTVGNRVDAVLARPAAGDAEEVAPRG